MKRQRVSDSAHHQATDGSRWKRAAQAREDADAEQRRRDRLVEAGFSEGTIIKRIEESPVEFDLSPAKVDELLKRRVTEAIIAAMRTAMGGK